MQLLLINMVYTSCLTSCRTISDLKNTPRHFRRRGSNMPTQEKKKDLKNIRELSSPHRTTAQRQSPRQTKSPPTLEENS